MRLFLTLVTATLVACSGAGTPALSGGALPQAMHSAGRAPLAIVAVSVTGSPIPYAGTLIEKIVRPLPAPSATQPPYTYTASVALTETVTKRTYSEQPYWVTGTTTVTGIPLADSTSFQDTYQLDPVPPGEPRNILRLKSVATDLGPNTDTIVYPKGDRVMNQDPESTGQEWYLTAAESYHEVDADGTTVERKVAADGSYVENDTYPDNLTGTITVNSNGTGTYAFETAPSDTKKSKPEMLTFAAPAGSPAKIVIVYTEETKSSTITLDAWFKNGDKLSSASGQDLGPKSPPSTCGKHAGTAPREIEIQRSRLDPVLGYKETQTTIRYQTSSLASTCAVFSDRTDDYYDYTRQTVGFDQGGVFEDTPQQITTIVQTLGATTSRSGPLGGAAESGNVAVEHALADRRLALHRFALHLSEAL